MDLPVPGCFSQSSHFAGGVDLPDLPAAKAIFF